MALAFLNRCGFRAASSGTGSFVVSAALTGMYDPANCANPSMVDGATYRYFAESDDKTEHEEGYGVWTTSTSTLTRAMILSSSNSGSAVSFSAAPGVYMGGPLAQEVVWEVIGDTQISSATQAVEHHFNPLDYSEIKIHYIDIENASSGVAENLDFGFQMQDDSDAVLLDYSNAIEVGFLGNVLMRTTIHQSLIMATGLVYDYEAVAFDVDGSGDNALGLNWQSYYDTPDLEGLSDYSGITKFVHFLSTSSGSHTVADAVNMTAGRIVTYGLRKP